MVDYYRTDPEQWNNKNMFRIDLNVNINKHLDEKWAF